MSGMRIWLIVDNYWVYRTGFNVINVSVHGASTIFGIALWNTQHVARWHWLIIELSAAFLQKNVCCNSFTMSKKWASTECQWLFALDLGKCKGCVVTSHHNRTIRCLAVQKWLQKHRYYVLMKSVNRASTTFGLASRKILELNSDMKPY